MWGIYRYSTYCDLSPVDRHTCPTNINHDTGANEHAYSHTNAVTRFDYDIRTGWHGIDFYSSRRIYYGK